MASAEQQAVQGDEQRLAELGYKQELSRSWSAFTNFAISFTIISVLAGCFTSFGFAWLNGGPVAVSIGWPVLCLLIFCVAFSMAELTSAYPTAGGPYWWAHDLGGKGWSWMTGWFNIVGLLGIVASVAYGAAIFVMPIGFLLTMYTETGYDASAHTAEETQGAAVAAAQGVWRSVFYSAIIGWILLLSFLFAATNVAAIDDGAGYSTFIFTSALDPWAAKLVILIASVGQLFCGAAGLTSASRTWYAFSRDRAIPGWALFRRVNKDRVPFNAVIGVSFFSLVIGIPALFGKNDIPF